MSLLWKKELQPWLGLAQLTVIGSATEIIIMMWQQGRGWLSAVDREDVRKRDLWFCHTSGIPYHIMAIKLSVRPIFRDLFLVGVSVETGWDGQSRLVSWGTDLWLQIRSPRVEAFIAQWRKTLTGWKSFGCSRKCSQNQNVIYWPSKWVYLFPVDGVSQAQYTVYIYIYIKNTG